MVTSQCWKTKKGQRIFSNNGNSSLGYALPAAIGECIALKKPVYCICGDGGFNFNIQELQTIRYYNLPIKILVFNNGCYGITKLYRDTHFNSNYAGCDSQHGVSSPDLAQIAWAYKIQYRGITNNNYVANRLVEVLDMDYPAIIDINMKGFYDYKPRLGWGVPIEDQFPFLDRKEFKQNMLIPPVDGWENPSYPGR